MLYALGIGAGHHPGSERCFTTENSGETLVAIPTMAAALAIVADNRPPFGSYDRGKFVHADQFLDLHSELPAAGTAWIKTDIVDVFSKEAGTFVQWRSRGYLDRHAKEPLFTSTSTGLLRADTTNDVHRLKRVDLPAAFGARDVGQIQESVWTTRPEQALLYRLSGDRNPLHSNPDVAMAGGFSGPLLHGLCVFGVACRAILGAGIASSDLAGMYGRFTKPVQPGETLSVRTWAVDDSKLRFQVLNELREIVIDRGEVTVRGGVPARLSAT